MKNSLRTMLLLIVSVALFGLTCTGCASTRRAQISPASEGRAVLPAREPIILVCQMDALSADQGVALLALPLAPLIRRDLFCVQQLSVIPTEDTSVPLKVFFMTERGLRKLAAAHGADMITVGLLKGDSESISIEFKAYDLKNNFIILDTEVEGKPSEFFSLQRELVYQFTDALGIILSEQERDRITSSRPRKLEAALCFGDGLKSELKEKYSDALIAYQEATFADKSLAVQYIAEARVFKGYNAPLRAMESIETAVMKDKFFAEAWYELNVYAARYKQDDDLAKKYCEQALEVAPRFGKAHLSLGTRLYALGDLAAAIEETKAAAKLLRSDPLPRYNLGIYYLDMSEPEQAQYWFEQALKVDPAFGLARSELQKLEGR